MSQSGPHLVGIGHLGITVHDLERSLEFYCSVLGFDRIARVSRSQPYIGELVGYPGVRLEAALVGVPGSSVVVELLEYRDVDRHAIDPAPANPATAHLSLLVRDIAELVEVLDDHAVRRVSEPVELTAGANAGGRAMYILDPDGFRVELIEPPRRSASATAVGGVQ